MTELVACPCGERRDTIDTPYGWLCRHCALTRLGMILTGRRIA